MDTCEPVQDTNPLTDSTFHLEKTPTNKSTFPVNLNQRHSKVNQDILKLLNKYFDHVILHKEKNFKGNYMYLIGKNFHEIPKKELTLLKKIYQEIFQFYKNLDVYGENLNVFDPTLRKEKNIVKFIRNFQTDNFIHNLVQFDTPKNNKVLNDFNKKLDKFHKDFFKLNI